VHDEHDSEQHKDSYNLTQAHYFLLILLFVSFYACYNIIEPYINSILLAIILAMLISPVQRKIEARIGGRKNLAALLSCALLTIIVVVPFGIILTALIKQGVDSFNNISSWVEAGGIKKLMENPWLLKIISLFDKYLPSVQKIFPEVNLKAIKIDEIFLQISSSIGKGLLNQGGSLFGNVTALIGKFFMMIFAFFFIVRDRDQLSNYILHLIPLAASHEHRIMIKVKSVARSALLGTFVTAVGQGIAGGIAFWISDLPGLFWGTMMAFASLIPIIGTALIWVPASIYLIFSGQWGYGIFMILWSGIVVGMIDNIVRPLFMKGSANMSTLFIFIAILGGINYFGLIGVLYGPLIFGITLVLLYIYNSEFEHFLNFQDKN